MASREEISRAGLEGIAAAKGLWDHDQLHDIDWISPKATASNDDMNNAWHTQRTRPKRSRGKGTTTEVVNPSDIELPKDQIMSLLDYNNGKLTRSMRNFGALAYITLRDLGSASYGYLADQVVGEINGESNKSKRRKGNSTDSGAAKDEKGLRRRVFDALNIMVAVGYAQKTVPPEDRAEYMTPTAAAEAAEDAFNSSNMYSRWVKWLGIPFDHAVSYSDPTPRIKYISPQQEIQELETAVQQQRKQLQETLLKRVAFERLLRRNAQVTRCLSERVPKTHDWSIQNRLHLPLVLVSMSASTQVHVVFERPDRSHLALYFRGDFQLHDDNDILDRLGFQLVNGPVPLMASAEVSNSHATCSSATTIAKTGPSKSSSSTMISSKQIPVSKDVAEFLETEWHKYLYTPATPPLRPKKPSETPESLLSLEWRGLDHATPPRSNVPSTPVSSRSIANTDQLKSPLRERITPAARRLLQKLEQTCTPQRTQSDTSVFTDPPLSRERVSTSASTIWNGTNDRTWHQESTSEHDMPTTNVQSGVHSELSALVAAFPHTLESESHGLGPPPRRPTLPPRE